MECIILAVISVETALKSSAGIVIALRRVNKGDEAYEEVCKTLDLKGTQYDRNADYIEEEVFFSQKNACPDCGISVPELQPRLFSFNNPFGACPDCTGLGEKMEFDRDLIMPDSSLSFNENGIVPFNPDSAWNESMFGAVFKDMDFDWFLSGNSIC